MARFHAWVTAGVLLTVVGCSTRKQQVVERLPRPTFEGPAVAAAPVQPPRAIPQTPPVPSRRHEWAGTPRGWVPPVAPRAWRWIVIHHSATPAGSAVRFDKLHRGKGWDELGYHFVIGNGTDTGDGQIEVGSRWAKQKHGAHTKTPNNDYNDRGIGICLVGNFDIERPTPAQMKAVERLTAYLMRTYRVGPANIIGHGDAKATDCPGRYMSVAAVRSTATRLAGQAVTPTPVRTASVEMLDMMP